MKLMTKELEKKVPKLGEGDHTAYAKYFTPWGSWTWYMTEYSPEAQIAYGYVEGTEKEWGYFSLAEMASVKGPFGLGIERDLNFEPRIVGKGASKR